MLVLALVGMLLNAWQVHPDHGPDRPAPQSTKTSRTKRKARSRKATTILNLKNKMLEARMEKPILRMRLPETGIQHPIRENLKKASRKRVLHKTRTPEKVIRRSATNRAAGLINS